MLKSFDTTEQIQEAKSRIDVIAKECTTWESFEKTAKNDKVLNALVPARIIHNLIQKRAHLFD